MSPLLPLAAVRDALSGALDSARDLYRLRRRHLDHLEARLAVAEGSRDDAQTEADEQRRRADAALDLLDEVLADAIRVRWDHEDGPEDGGGRPQPYYPHAEPYLTFRRRARDLRAGTAPAADGEADAAIVDEPPSECLKLVPDAAHPGREFLKLFCTLPKGHDGEHLARTRARGILGRWHGEHCPACSMPVIAGGSYCYDSDGALHTCPHAPPETPGVAEDERAHRERAEVFGGDTRGVLTRAGLDNHEIDLLEAYYAGVHSRDTSNAETPRAEGTGASGPGCSPGRGAASVDDPTADPVGAVRVHPDDDPGDAGARRAMRYGVRLADGETGVYCPWLLVTGVDGGTENELRDDEVTGWPRQSLADLARVLGHPPGDRALRVTAEIGLRLHDERDDLLAERGRTLDVLAPGVDTAGQALDEVARDAKTAWTKLGREEATSEAEAAEVEPTDRPEPRPGGVRAPAPVAVRCVDGDPVSFDRRPVRADGHYTVTEVMERWIEESRWPFRTSMPVGGDRCRCWRVQAKRRDEPNLPPGEFVLRMRSGPAVWDLRWITPAVRSADPAADVEPEF